MGKHGLGEMSENGELFGDLLFLKQGRHRRKVTRAKAAWGSPDKRTTPNMHIINVQGDIVRCKVKRERLPNTTFLWADAVCT